MTTYDNLCWQANAHSIFLHCALCYHSQDFSKTTVLSRNLNKRKRTLLSHGQCVSAPLNGLSNKEIDLIKLSFSSQLSRVNYIEEKYRPGVFQSYTQKLCFFYTVYSKEKKAIMYVSVLRRLCRSQALTFAALQNTTTMFQLARCICNPCSTKYQAAHEHVISPKLSAATSVQLHHSAGSACFFVLFLATQFLEQQSTSASQQQ